MYSTDASQSMEIALARLRAIPGGSALLTATTPPAPTPTVQQSMGEEQMRQLLREELDKYLGPQLRAIFNEVESIFQRALSPADYQAFKEYTTGGSPGFERLTQGEQLFPLAQLLWEVIKENIK